MNLWPITIICTAGFFFIDWWGFGSNFPFKVMLAVYSVIGWVAIFVLWLGEGRSTIKKGETR